MADRSTAAVGVANEGGQSPPADQQDGATSDGSTTDDQTSGVASADAAPEEQPPNASQPTGGDPGAAPAAEQEPGDDEAADATEPADPADTVAVAALDDADRASDPGADPAPTRAEPAVKPATPPRAKRDAAPLPEAAPLPKAAPRSKAATGARPDPAADAGRDSATDSAPEPAQNPSEASTAVLKPPVRPVRRELHSGHKLARRYQLEECVTRVDGFSSWRAVDEKLRRAVGIHLLPADHERARQVLAAARSAALLGDPRFVQVLDAVEDGDLVYVIHEWLPDATPLADLLAGGPLEPHEAYQMVSQVSQGMAAAHREGLAHLRLDAGAVLRTVSGQYRIRGLAVAAALRGLRSERPQRQDTESIGALLYAALTQRWPYEEDAHGLPGLPRGAGLVAPDQVRAGVHRGLSEIAMRALVNNGATASREDPPCTTPEELAKAVAGVPRIRPPEQVPPVYQPTAFSQPPPPLGVKRAPVAAPVPPPALPGRTGSALKWAVSALVIVAIALGSWQLADALKSSESRAPAPQPTGQKGGHVSTPAPPKPITIAHVKDFDPLGDESETPSQVDRVDDGDLSTYWQTSWYTRANFGGLKSGVGVVLDLGSPKTVSSVNVSFAGASTSVDLMAAGSGAARPTSLDGFSKVASGTGTTVKLKPASKVTSRYLLVWLTKLPPLPDGRFRGRIAEINVTG